MADGFAMLEHDHRAVGELFDDYEQGGDPAVAKQICFELTAHGELEEQVLYFDLRDFGDKTSQLADNAEEANDLIDQTIGRVALADPDDLHALMVSLRSMVEAHVREEEEDMFPEMRDLGVDPQKLGRDLEAARDAAVARAREKLG
jgi:hemerythrin superfamily protein